MELPLSEPSTAVAAELLMDEYSTVAVDLHACTSSNPPPTHRLYLLAVTADALQARPLALARSWVAASVLVPTQHIVNKMTNMHRFAPPATCGIAKPLCDAAYCGGTPLATAAYDGDAT